MLYNAEIKYYVTGVCFKLKKISLITALFLILLFTKEAPCSEGMGISSSYFLKRMGYACVKVKNGISSVTIASEIQDAGKSKRFLDCGNKLMLVLTESEDEKELLNVAIMYFVDTNVDEERSSSISRSYENSRFENICRQLIFSLDRDISDSEAESTLRSIGIYGNMLDGVQRSRTVKGYRCMLKLQPGGMIMMVISKI
ncbi:MAG: hypothetical protein GX672_09080 [Synergistaceae bacterium]|nr:hypothetical protein [Synergistaceae bacterium]